MMPGTPMPIPSSGAEFLYFSAMRWMASHMSPMT